MKIAELVPMLAYFGVQLSGIPSILRIRKNKSVGQSDPLMFLMLVINGFVWSTYGIFIFDMIVTISNLVGIIMGIIYCSVYYEYTNNKLQMQKYFQVTFLFITLLFLFSYFIDINIATNIIGLFGSFTAILLMSSPLSNMKKVFKDKTSIHLPIFTVIANFINSLSWLLYGIFINNKFIWYVHLFMHPCAYIYKYIYNKGTKFAWINSKLYTNMFIVFISKNSCRKKTNFRRSITIVVSSLLINLSTM